MNSNRLYSFKELDETLKRPKGSAFRLFKARLEDLVEGRDFIILDHREKASDIQELKDCGRVYRQSVNVVLLSPQTFDLLCSDAAEQSG